MNLFLFILGASSVFANHVRLGRDTMTGEFDSFDGRHSFSSVADIRMPVVCWEDLRTESVSLAKCNLDRLRFTGTIDRTDFQNGNVITFPKEEYKSMGCPLPPVTDELSKMDGVIFRKIEAVRFRSGGVSVKTSFISGDHVVPFVSVHLGGLVDKSIPSSSRQKFNQTSLAPSVRQEDGANDNWGDDDTIEITGGVKLTYGVQMSGGIGNIELRRTFPPTVSWDMTLTAGIFTKLEIEAAISKEISGDLVNWAVPGAGAVIPLPLLGETRVGLIAGVGYVGTLDLSLTTTLEGSATVSAGRKFVYRQGVFPDISTEALTSEGSNFRGGVDVGVETEAVATAFAGLRLSVGAELTIGAKELAGSEIAGSFGLELSARAKTPPYDAIEGSSGDCAKCHRFQGALKLQGRNLEFAYKIPLQDEESVTLKDVLFEYPIKTVCKIHPASCRPNAIICRGYPGLGFCMPSSLCNDPYREPRRGDCSGPPDIQCCVPKAF